MKEETKSPKAKVIYVYSQRSPVVQKKLDETNAALAKLSQEGHDLLFSEVAERKGSPPKNASSRYAYDPYAYRLLTFCS